MRIALSMLLMAFTLSMNAQRIISELETNSDLTMDSRPEPEQESESTSEKKKTKVIPHDIRAWNIDEKYGNIAETQVDTLHHMFMNTDLPEGIEGHYNSLGNVGSPRI